MKVLLLTTDTPHHLYLAWKICETWPLAAIVLETWRCVAPFETAHSFEAARESFERDTLLSGFAGSFPVLTKTIEVPTVNDAESLARMAAIRPDVTVVFGTGRLGRAAIGGAGVCLNLHGGNPEAYRGLDSHLWAIYHEDFDNLVTTLHHVDEDLDTGDVAYQTRLPLTRGTRIHQLRTVNTQACADLVTQALSDFDATGAVPATPQRTRGRYYSFMPGVLKPRCVKNFERFVEQL